MKLCSHRRARTQGCNAARIARSRQAPHQGHQVPASRHGLTRAYARWDMACSTCPASLPVKAHSGGGEASCAAPHVLQASRTRGSVRWDIFCHSVRWDRLRYMLQNYPLRCWPPHWSPAVATVRGHGCSRGLAPASRARALWSGRLTSCRRSALDSCGSALGWRQHCELPAIVIQRPCKQLSWSASRATKTP